MWLDINLFSQSLSTIFVKDREKAIQKFTSQHSSSGILIKYINPDGKYENIYDSNNLQEYYFKLKKLLEQYDYLQTSKNIEDFDKCKKILIRR